MKKSTSLILQALYHSVRRIIKRHQKELKTCYKYDL